MITDVSSKKKVNDIGRQDAVLCLAAGKSQEPVLAVAKSLGYIVAAVDKDQNAPGFKYADVAIYESTYDAKAIIKELDLLEDQYRWIGILNRSSGQPVVVAAELSEYFDIPGVPVESARTLVNKDRLRKACSKYSIPSPKYETWSITDDKSIGEVQFPAVIKPALSLVGKSGISVVRSNSSIDAAVKYATENTMNQEVIIEEFLPGHDVSLISFIQDGKLCPICFLDELNIEQDKGTISGRGFKTHSPSDGNRFELMAHELSQKLANVFNIKRSAFMVSFRGDSDGNLRLVEVHLDLGGDLLIEELFPRALSIDFLKFAVEMAVGRTICPQDIHVKPTAIFFEKGNGLVSERGFTVFTADSHYELDKKILRAGY